LTRKNKKQGAFTRRNQMIISDLSILEVVQANDVVGGTNATAIANIAAFGPSLTNGTTLANVITIQTPLFQVSDGLAVSNVFTATLGATNSNVFSGTNG